MNEDAAAQNERHALRAFLQRAEVRLSTMHRVAGAFLSGAGLLLLAPLFLKEAITSVILTSVTLLSHVKSDALIWDVRFYFVSHTIEFGPEPSQDEGDSLPRFALSAIVLSTDEAGSAKARIRQEQKFSNLNLFVDAWEWESEESIDQWICSHSAILLPESQSSNLQAPLSEEIRLRAAFALANAIDLTLIQEVAKQEASLVRHNCFLRRLVLRYFKALITLLWTVLWTFIIIGSLSKGIIGVAGLRSSLLMALSLYLVWSLSIYFVVRLPFRWIAESNAADPLTKKVVDKSKSVSPLGNERKRLIATPDADLTAFEARARLICVLGCAIALLGMCAASYGISAGQEIVLPPSLFDKT